MRESFSKSKNSWKVDLKTNSTQHEILKQIIDSSTKESSKATQIPSKNDVTKNYFPVKSMNSHFIKSQNIMSNNILRTQSNVGGKSQNLNNFGKKEKEKTISRSLPRSPVKKREASQEVDIYRRDSKTGKLVKSGRRIVTFESSDKRGR